MYLHLGQDYIVLDRDIVGIFDLDTTTSAGRITNEFLTHAERDGVVITTTDALPKSFVVTDFPVNSVFVSQLSTATLKGRAYKLKIEN